MAIRQLLGLNTRHVRNTRTETGMWAANLRFSWLRTANTGLFLVYNDTEDLNGLGPVNRAFTTAASWGQRS